MKQVVTESNLASLNIHARPGSTGNRLCCQKASGGCAPPTPPPPLSLSSDPFASHMIRMLLQFFGCSLRRAQVRWKVLTGLKKQHCSLSLILIACASFAGKHQKCMWSGNEGVSGSTASHPDPWHCYAYPSRLPQPGSWRHREWFLFLYI